MKRYNATGAGGACRGFLFTLSCVTHRLSLSFSKYSYIIQSTVLLFTTRVSLRHWDRASRIIYWSIYAIIGAAAVHCRAICRFIIHIHTITSSLHPLSYYFIIFCVYLYRNTIILSMHNFIYVQRFCFFFVGRYYYLRAHWFSNYYIKLISKTLKSLLLLFIIKYWYSFFFLPNKLQIYIVLYFIVRRHIYVVHLSKSTTVKSLQQATYVRTLTLVITHGIDRTSIIEKLFWFFFKYNSYLTQ